MLIKKLIILLILLPVVLAGCRSSYPEINLKPPEDMDTVSVPTPHYHPASSVSVGPEEALIRVAIAPVVSPPQTRENYRRVLSYLPEKLGQPVELVLRSTYAEINQLIKQGMVDVAFIGSWSYVELEEADDVEMLVRPQIRGQTEYHSYIIVPADSGAGSLEDLQDKKFVFTDPLSFPGKMYVSYRLARMGETPDSFFSDYIFSYSHDNSIVAVAEGWVEAAAVDSLVYGYLMDENPELEEKVRIVEQSPPLGNPPVVISSGLPAELREKIKEIFLTMHENPEGQRALSEMRVERFLPAGDEDYDTVREILKELSGIGGGS